MDFQYFYRLEFTDQIDESEQERKLIELTPILKEHGIEIREFDIGQYVFLKSTEKAREILLEEGMTNFLINSVDVSEAVLPIERGSSSKNSIDDILRFFLRKISPNKNFVIIDNYFFHVEQKNETDYLNRCLGLFKHILPNIDKFDFVINKRRRGYNTNLENQVTKAFRKINPNLSMCVKDTDIFHDRIWLSDLSRGIFVGTSLNHIGKRYALIDKIHEDDCYEIVSILKKHKIIT